MQLPTASTNSSSIIHARRCTPCPRPHSSSSSSRPVAAAARRGDVQAPLQHAAQQPVSARAPAELDSHQLLVPLEPAAPPASSGLGGGKLVGVLGVLAALTAGFVYSRTRRSSADPFAGVNKIHMEELDPEIIAAARARRSQERANFKLDLDDVELPDNHPFATRKPLTPEQEASITARLQARPRRAPAGTADARPGGPRARR